MLNVNGIVFDESHNEVHGLYMKWPCTSACVPKGIGIHLDLSLQHGLYYKVSLSLHGCCIPLPYA